MLRRCCCPLTIGISTKRRTMKIPRRKKEQQGREIRGTNPTLDFLWRGTPRHCRPTTSPSKDLSVKGDDYEKLTQRTATLQRRLAEHSLPQGRLGYLSGNMVRNYGIKGDLLERVKAVRNEARALSGHVIKRDEPK